MPKSHTDWSLAKTLYDQGVPVHEIGAKLGINKHTLASTISRQKWKQKRDTALQGVPTVPQPRATRSFADRVASIRSGLLERAEEMLVALKARDPKSYKLSDLESLERIEASLAKRTALVGGFEQEASEAVINVTIMGKIGDELEAASEVIDVEPLPEPGKVDGQ